MCTDYASSPWQAENQLNEQQLHWNFQQPFETLQQAISDTLHLGMEDKEDFLQFLDASLQVLRKHLASAYDAKLAKFDASSKLLNLEGDLNLLAQRQPCTPNFLNSNP